MTGEDVLVESQEVVGARAAQSWRILTEIDELRDRVQRRIKDVFSVSEKETLACGNVLSEIMVKARQLADESERQIAESKTHSEEIASRFVNGMKEDLLAQQAAVQKVMELANGIEAAIAAINDLTLSSRVLAINARIEAARLGEHGKGFAVIAGSLNGLSAIIQNASDSVSSSIQAVREGLPPVSARADSLHERTQRFIEEVAAQVNANRNGRDRASAAKLSDLMELSNRAISHLQFHDPMVQKLAEVEVQLGLAKQRVEMVLNGVSELQQVKDSDSADDPPAGEILLF